MTKILDIAYYALLISVVIIIAILYYKWLKQEKENSELRNKRIEEERAQNKLLFEAQMLLNEGIKKGEIKVHIDKDCGCKDKEKKNSTKKKSNAKV